MSLHFSRYFVIKTFQFQICQRTTQRWTPDWNIDSEFRPQVTVPPKKASRTRKGNIYNSNLLSIRLLHL
jgi:hypothetical protein